MIESKRVISAKVSPNTYADIERIAEALMINKNELIDRSVRLFIASYNHAVTMQASNGGRV